MTDEFRHPRCYARELGECSPKLSREHYISRQLCEHVMQGEGSTVQADFFRAKVSVLPPSSDLFVARNLCVKHNNALSELDEQALHFFHTAERIERHLLDTTRPIVARFRVSGDKLERWFLKSLCGFVASGNALHRGKQLGKITPSLDWLRILFGLEQMPPEWGLYGRGFTDVEKAAGGLSLGTLINEQNVVIGCIGSIRNWGFLLAMTKPILGGNGGLLEDAVFHPLRYSFETPNDDRYAFLELDWGIKSKGGQYNIMFENRHDMQSGYNSRRDVDSKPKRPRKPPKPRRQ